MAINYNVAKCKNPNGAEGVDYFSCKARKTSDYTFKELAQDINNSTTVTKADAMAVLASMKPFIESALLGGRRVVLDDLGSLVISVRSKCFTKADMQESDFMPSAKIKGYGIIFRPEVELKKNLAKSMRYQIVASEAYNPQKKGS